jgi:hypothetical protein
LQSSNTKRAVEKLYAVDAVMQLPKQIVVACVRFADLLKLLKTTPLKGSNNA